MALGWIIRTSQIALHAAKETLRPPHGATPLQIRKNGAITVALGLLFFGISGATLAVVPSEMALRAASMPSLAGYAFVVVGGYGVLLGHSPEATSEREASIRRILVAIAAVVLFVFVPLALVALVGIAMEGR
ncbi:MAG: hypothetical protein JW751_26095 [Polyangiaceae bacterium]|nr:hypothetical protein [Polyangiaceae bacterium]